MKGVGFILVGIFVFCLVSAQVTISPVNFSISQKVGETKTYQITINNSYPFNISRITFGNLSNQGYSFSNSSVNSNSSKSVTITATPTSSFQGERTERISFKFFADIPTAVTTYFINITSTGFKENNLVIRQGDSIVFSNKDTIIHNVLSTEFNQNINPGESYIYTFNNIGSIPYQDQDWSEFNNFRGSVQVISRTSQEEINNPTYDFDWVIQQNIFLNPTNTQFEVVDNNFTINATDSSEGLIRVRNTGTEKAENIKLSSNSSWIGFSKNNFDLSPGEQALVVVKITPLIFSTEETNKNYTVQVQLTGSNIESKNENIKVFIPFTEVFSDSSSAEYVFALLDKFCKNNPKNVFCDPSQQVILSNNSGNDSLNLNITTADYLQTKRDLSVISTSLGRLGNDYQAIKELIPLIETALNMSNQSIERQEENEKRIDRTLTLAWIIGFIIFLGVLIYLVAMKQKRVSRTKDLSEGAYQYQ